MVRNHRPLRRWLGLAAAVAPILLLAGCLTTTSTAGAPNSTFQHTTEFNSEIYSLWQKLLFAGTAVFVLVEALLVYAIVKFRRKPGDTSEPEHVHGNTTLEILWTVIPAVILVFIAIPTVRTIFRTQAKAVSSALQVEVVGHQWWWEFRYPQYGVVTANELYLPVGRTVNFALRTEDVLHSFWIPRLGGKRDLIANHTNYLWFTVTDSMAAAGMLNGSCNEYCGASHANMKFRVVAVSPADFESWARHQAEPAVGTTAPATPASPAAPGNVAAAPNKAQARSAGVQTGATTAQVAQQVTPQSGTPGVPATTSAPEQAMANGGTVGAPGGYVVPASAVHPYNVPHTPLPAIAFPAGLRGNPQAGQQAFLLGGCVGCHYIKGNPIAMGKVGPNLTHVATRTTIAGALYPNDTEHLLRWVKNAPKMKPGSRMPTIGKGEINPETNQSNPGGLTDQQIADVVAYLQSLK